MAREEEEAEKGDEGREEGLNSERNAEGGWQRGGGVCGGTREMPGEEEEECKSSRRRTKGER